MNIRSHTRSAVVLAVALVLACGAVPASPQTTGADSSAEAARLLQSAAELKSRYADREAVELYEHVLRRQPDHPEALWNASYLHLRLGWLSPDGTARRTHYQTAYEVALRAYRLDPEHYEAQLVLGASKAKMAEYLGTGDQVRTARELKDHARFLLHRRADNPDVWYLYAWWHFKVSRVSAAERFFAALLFGGLPDGASTPAAFACLRKAIALRPDYCAYYHDLGLFYERTGELDTAADLYRRAATLPARTPEDIIYIGRARDRLTRLNPPPRQG